jgi:hypothetical protein
LGGQCTGKHDPKCDGACENGTCGNTTTEHNNNKHSCAAAAVEGCKDGRGFECKESGDFHCNCRCK